MSSQPHIDGIAVPSRAFRWASLARSASVLALVALLAGCGGGGGSSQEEIVGDPVPRQGALGFVNAISDAGTISFVHRGTNTGFTSGDLNFGVGTGAQVFLVGEFAAQLGFNDADGSQVLLFEDLNIGVFEDDEKTFIAAGTLAMPTIIEVANREFLFGLSGAERLALRQDPELQFVHAAVGAGPLDYYVVADGTDLNSATPLASQSFSEQSGLLTISIETAANARIFVTPAGDPNTILYDAGEIGFNPTTRSLLVVTDYFGPAAEPGDVRISSFAVAQQPFPNEVLGAAVRVVNLAGDLGPVDVHIDGAAVASFADDLAPLDATSYFPIEPGEHDVTITAGDDASDIVLTQTTGYVAGIFHSVYLVGNRNDPATGEARGITATVASDDRRALGAGKVSLRALYASGSSAGVANLFLLNADETTADANPLLSATIGGTALITFDAGVFDAVVTDTTGTVVAGPQSVTVVPGQEQVLTLLDAPGGGTPVQIELVDTVRPDPAP